MSYLPVELDKKIFEKRIPVDVTLEINNNCNMACKFCYVSDDKKEMTTNEIKRILDKLKDEGCLFLTVTGGEPLLRKDIFEILDYATDFGFSVTLKTNGILINKEHAHKLKTLNLQEIHISLLAGTAEKHDELTRLKGSFNKAVNAIKLLKAENIKIYTMSVITHGYVEEMLKIQELVRSLGISDDCQTFTSFIFPKNNKDKDSLQYNLTDNELRQFYNFLKESPQNDPMCNSPENNMLDNIDDIFLSCKVGRNGFLIKHDGKVHPCLSLPFEIGDIKTQSVRDIVNSKEVDQIIEMVDVNNNTDCSNCPDMVGCFRCPGMAYLNGQEITSAPEEGCRQNKIVQEILNG